MDVLNRRERERAKLVILVVFGLWSTYEQWCRILLPFTQWQLMPRANLFDTLLLNSIGNGSMLLGSFLIAHLVDSIGGRRAAMICVCFTSTYQAVICWVRNYYVFGALQFLLLFNQMPSIVDALIARVVGEHSDNKERTKMLMRVTIPASIAFATGPYVAVQILYLFNPGLELVQSLCGVAQALTLLPILYWVLPESHPESAKGVEARKIELPGLSSSSFYSILKDGNIRWTLLFIIFVAGPYSAYDQAMRVHLTGTMLTKPNEMARITLLLGGCAFATNIFLLPFLQRKLRPQSLIELAFALMIGSYLYLAHVQPDYHLLLCGMPFQVVGVCVALGQLTAQIMFAVPRSHMGKAAALNRAAQLTATVISPILTGYYTEAHETAALCYVSALICIGAIALVHKYGHFVGQSIANLPVRND